MLTDDQLTRDLARAFHAAADDLRYTGRVPRPRPEAMLAVPALAAAAALVAVPVTVTHLGGSDEPDPTTARPATSVVATPSPTPTAQQSGGGGARGRLVTGDLRLAGFGLRVDGSSAGDDVYAVLGVGIPDGASEVTVPGGPQAYAGTDAETGDAAVFVRAAAGGRTFELTSATLTVDQLAQLLRPDHARPVPAVTR